MTSTTSYTVTKLPTHTTISFEIINSNLPAFEVLFKTIQNAILSKNSVPFEPINELTQLMMPIGYNPNNSLIGDAVNVIIKAVEYFGNTSRGAYNIKGEYTHKDGSSEALSLNNLFTPIMIDYFSNKNDKRFLTKETTLTGFYNQIRAYRELFDETLKEKINHYKIAVMSAYLTHFVGFLMFDKKKTFTNKDFYQSSRSVLDKFKKELI